MARFSRITREKTLMNEMKENSCVVRPPTISTLGYLRNSIKIKHKVKFNKELENNNLDQT